MKELDCQEVLLLFSKACTQPKRIVQLLNVQDRGGWESIWAWQEAVTMQMRKAEPKPLPELVKIVHAAYGTWPCANMQMSRRSSEWYTQPCRSGWSNVGINAGV